MVGLLEENLPTVEAQQLRRQIAAGKKMVFVSCPYAASSVLHEYAQQVLGVEIYIMAPAGDAFSVDLVKKGVAKGHIAAETGHPSKAVELCVAAIESSGLEFDGVFTMHEIAIPLVCGITDALKYPGNSSEAASNARNKHRAREICQQNGLNTPRFAKITSAQDLLPASLAVKFPAVVKPSSGAGSEGVIRVDSLPQLQAAYEKILRDRETSQSLNWNPGQDSDHVSAVVLEQYILGDEVDIDCLFWDGECVFSSITDNWPTFEPYFLETGSNCPTKFPLAIQNEISTYAISVVKALGFRQGAFHVEAKYGPDGPQLIEVNPRMGGGPVCEFNLDVHGVHMFENFVLSALGIPINPPRAAVPLCYTSHYSINAPITGILENTTFCDHLKADPHLEWVHYICEAGKKVNGLDSGLPDWVAEFRVKGSSVQESNRIAEEMFASVVLPIRVDSVPAQDLPPKHRRTSSA
eukprot:Sdes_comp10199_c0_seq1m1813